MCVQFLLCHVHFHHCLAKYLLRMDAMRMDDMISIKSAFYVVRGEDLPMRSQLFLAAAVPYPVYHHLWQFFKGDRK